MTRPGLIHHLVLVAWEMLPVLSVYALQDGSTAIVFWALIAGVIGMTFVYTSLAEMASMWVTWTSLGD